jgi:hypothetical protein
MAYDLFRRKMVGGDVSRMGADAMEVAQALRNNTITDAQAASALKKGIFKGSVKIGAASLLSGFLLGRYMFPKR